MVYRAIFRQLCALATSLFFVCLSAFAVASEPAFWVASKGTAKVYLFGSMHFGREDFYPLPELVEEAFAASSKLVVEVNLLNLGADAQQVIFHHAGLPIGKGLQDVLSADTYTALENQAARSRVPVTAFHRFQPWYVTLMLVEAEIRKTDLRQQLGLDLYFLRRAAASAKPIVELETFESQLRLFSNLSLEDQEKFLRQTLADLENSQSYLAAMANAWMQGDVDTLNKSLVEPFRERGDTKILFEQMFTLRNNKMVESVAHYFEPGEKTFMVVGVGHMLGRDGIIAQLKDQGVNVRRVDVRAHVDDREESISMQSPP